MASANSVSCNDSIGALYFINGKGDVLVQRTYRDDIESNLAGAFRTQVINSKDSDAASLAPVRQFGDCRCARGLGCGLVLAADRTVNQMQRVRAAGGKEGQPTLRVAGDAAPPPPAVGRQLRFLVPPVVQLHLHACRQHLPPSHHKDELQCYDDAGVPQQGGGGLPAVGGGCCFAVQPYYAWDKMPVLEVLPKVPCHCAHWQGAWSRPGCWQAIPPVVEATCGRRVSGSRSLLATAGAAATASAAAAAADDVVQLADLVRAYCHGELNEEVVKGGCWLGGGGCMARHGRGSSPATL